MLKVVFLKTRFNGENLEDFYANKYLETLNVVKRNGQIFEKIHREEILKINQ